ncbi:unnamed protein product [Ciceribacter sp. T2.26MG-112.2]|nr:unnamed protein product [Ciceribacter naphthalenivorans]
MAETGGNYQCEGWGDAVGRRGWRAIPPRGGDVGGSRQRGVAACDDGGALVEADDALPFRVVPSSPPPLSCRRSSLQSVRWIDCSAARTVPHRPQGGRSTRGRPLAQPNKPVRPHALRFRCHFLLPRPNLSGRGASGCRVR